MIHSCINCSSSNTAEVTAIAAVSTAAVPSTVVLTATVRATPVSEAIVPHSSNSNYTIHK